MVVWLIGSRTKDNLFKCRGSWLSFWLFVKRFLILIRYWNLSIWGNPPATNHKVFTYDPIFKISLQYKGTTPLIHMETVGPVKGSWCLRRSSLEFMNKSVLGTVFTPPVISKRANKVGNLIWTEYKKFRKMNQYFILPVLV